MGDGIRETQEILLNIQLQKLMDLVCAETTIAQHGQLSTDGIVEILCRIWKAIQTQPGWREDMRCLQVVQDRLEHAVKVRSPQEPTADMLWQDIDMDVQLREAMGAILQIGPGTGKLHIGTQLTDIAWAVVEQQGAQNLRRDMDIGANTAALCSEEGTD